LKIDKVEPHLTFKVWGGEKLWPYKSPQKSGELKDKPEEPLGETWEVSLHEDGVSKTSDGRLLTELYSSSELPYLIKFIDTGANLSIQVHPDDDYAKLNENSSGKTECWLILDAEPGAGIYLGLKDGVSKDMLNEAISKNERVDKLLNYYEVTPGEFFYVPARSIHAIGEGVTLAEIQQSSGITYRVWDWNRLGLDGKPRELHIDKALEVINFDSAANTKESFNHIGNVFNGENEQIAKHRDFSVRSYSLSSGDERLLPKVETVTTVVVLDGELECGNQTLTKFECATLSPNQDNVCVRIKTETKFLIVS